jgi:2,4'-dihydroxyacetophenone dioxygenase
MSDTRATGEGLPAARARPRRPPRARVRDRADRFWRDLKPIEKVFQTYSLPETDTPNIAAADDDRYYVPLERDGRHAAAVDLPVAQNSWCDVLLARSAGLVNRHYHPHEVFADTTFGQVGPPRARLTATAGDFGCETPGEAHTLVAYESDEPMKVHFKVRGPLNWLDEKVGLGADYIDSLLR